MRILVIEDSPAIVDALDRGLTAEGFDVDVARSGPDGLWRAREFGYDALVLDIMLPGKNGYDVCRELRADGVDTPILMLTAKDGEYDIAEGLELGADDYLVKPFSFVVLVARLRAVMRRRNRSSGDPVVHVGPLEVDTTSRRCRVDGVEVALTPREYALLETLVRRSGIPLTRLELLDHVWGADVDAGSNVVDVYIGYLRKKLAAAGAPGVVETVRGVGYRVDDTR